MNKILLPFMLLLTSQGMTQKTKSIDSLLKLYESFDEMNGCVLLAEKGEVVYEQAFGKAVFEWETANTVDTKFEIASASKPFTALVVLQLIQEGKLRPDGKIRDYLPEYPEPMGNKITIEQLLLHTSGLTDTRFIEHFDVRQGMQALSRSELLSVFSTKDLLFEPGTQWSYSNFGYNLLACIAERVSGKSLHQLLHERIFKPCGMKNSSSTESSTIHERLARPYERRFGDIQPGHYHHSSSSPGSSNVITTVKDYHLFYQHLTKGKLLKKDLLRRYLSPHTRLSGEVTGYNFWFDKLPVPGSDTIHIIRSAGTMYGWNSVIYHIPQNEKLLVMFFNVKNNRMFEIADNMLNILYDLPYKKPKDSYAHIFFKDEQRYGLNQAVERYRQLGEDEHTPKKFRDFNRLGYYYLEKGCTDHAIAVFTLNTELFPDDAGVYDSLGEGYMMKGEKEKAIFNYERSLELDPANDNARAMLEKLRSE